MKDSAQESIQDKLRQLRANYTTQLKERLEKIEHLMKLKEKGPLGLNDLLELQSQAHKLSGSGATYGFPSISATGRALEDWLVAHLDDSPDTMALVLKLALACREAVQSAQDVPSPLSQDSAPPLSNASSDAHLPLVLIVDDDSHCRDMLRELLSGDARIITGSHTGEALELMTKYKPDLVLLDDMMPGGVSGLKMLEDRKLMPDIREIPVVMITASNKPEEVMRGLTAGAADYIVKPFNPDSVVSRIRARLKRISTLVLIADDDESVREILSHKFYEAGLKVICAKDGHEAWSIIQKREVALAVLDLNMPGIDGMSLLRKIKETASSHDVPVIFLTASHCMASVKEGVAAGVTEYIVKPVDPYEVIIRSLRLLKLSNK